MKKFIIALICISAAISLCGCSENNNPAGNSDLVQDGGSSNDSGSETANARELAERALNADEWPGMDFVTDQELVNALFSEKMVLEDFEDYALVTNIISATLNKVLVIRPKADKADEVEAAMNEYYEYILNEGAFYPGQEASVAGSVKGKTPNGYFYLIIHENGAKIADKMLAG